MCVCACVLVCVCVCARVCVCVCVIKSRGCSLVLRKPCFVGTISTALDSVGTMLC